MKKLFFISILLVLSVYTFNSGIADQYLHLLKAPYLTHLQTTPDPSRILAVLKSHNTSDEMEVIINLSSHLMEKPLPQDTVVNNTSPEISQSTFFSEFHYDDNNSEFWVYSSPGNLTMKYSISISENAKFWTFISPILDRFYIIYTESYEHWQELNGTAIPLNNVSAATKFPLQWDTWSWDDNHFKLYEEDQLLSVYTCCYGTREYYYRFSEDKMEYITTRYIESSTLIDSRVKQIISANALTNEIEIVNYDINEKITRCTLNWSQKYINEFFTTPTTHNNSTFSFGFLFLLPLIVYKKQVRKK